MLCGRSWRLAARLLSPGLLSSVPGQLPLVAGCCAPLSVPGGSSYNSDGSTASGGGSSSQGAAERWPVSWRPFSAAATATPDWEVVTAADSELPLWRFLLQQGFSAACVGRLQAAFSSGKLMCSIPTGQRLTEARLQRELAPNIAALRVEGLDAASIGRLFEHFPALLTTTHTTFSSSLAALRQLAALLPDDPRAVQAPPGATQLGVALWLYPTAAAYLLARVNLASLIEGNLRLRQQLGINYAEAAAAIMKSRAGLVSDLERGEALVAHLQRLQASGALTAEQVTRVASAQALRLTPAEFDRRRLEGGCLTMMNYSDPAGRRQAAAQALGELLQAADGVPGPLQHQYWQQAEALVARGPSLWMTGPTGVRASWASLQQVGLSGSQAAAVARRHPVVLTHNWAGEAGQRLLTWVQQELGLSPCDFITRHIGYTTYSVTKLAMRADFLRQHRPAVWAASLARGTGPLLSLLTQSHSRFCARAQCTEDELAAFNRAWLATPAGRHWGSKPRHLRRSDATAAM